MNIITIEPKNEKLRKYIYSYFILNQSKEQQSEFIVFPSLFPNLSFSKNSYTVVGENKITTQESDKESIECFLTINNSKPIHYKYIGNIYEISISFKPLGINFFLPQTLQFYAQKEHYNDCIYEDGPNAFAKILTMSNENEAIEALEQYLLTKYKPFEHNNLENIISDLFNTKGNLSIEEITQKYQLSRQTLNTYFQRYLCRSAVESRRIIRFRCGSELFFQDSLTKLTYDLHFFDQSHLIKDFKTLTGFTPKQFFSRLQTTNGTHLIWV